jgi:uncharacterized repeat protein (TIGR03803 family)
MQEENMQKGCSLLALLVSFGVLLGLCLPASAQTYTYSTLYNFKSDSNSSAPSAPSALLVDTAGNLYGTTAFGGKEGAGTVYELSAGGVFTVLHVFNGTDGYSPHSLTRDRQGNLYGTTWQVGYPGTVFKMVKGSGGHYAFTSLYSAAFAEPGGVAVDASGNLYGTDPGNRGCLCVFEVPAGGQWQDIYDTGGQPTYPVGNVLIGQSGGAYASIDYEGIAASGSVVEVQGGDGFFNLPNTVSGSGYLGQDAAGNIYALAWGENPYGLFVKMDVSTGTVSTLYNFTGGTGGDAPFAPFAVDATGNIYGVAQGGMVGKGFVFKITPQGKQRVLYVFPKDNNTNGASSGISMDGTGNLYGYTTLGGTYNGGTIYKLTLAK